MTRNSYVVDLSEIDCHFEHIVFDPKRNRAKGYVKKRVNYQAKISFVL